MGTGYSSFDYALLVEGILWMLLLAPALTFARGDRRRQWKWFAGYATVGAVLAWAQMFRHDLGYVTGLCTLRGVLRAGAVFFLIEFGRREIGRLSGRPAGRAIHFIWLVALGAIVAFAGSDVGVALASVFEPLGLLLAAAAWWRMGSVQRPAVPCLRTTAVALAGMAVCAAFPSGADRLVASATPAAVHGREWLKLLFLAIATGAALCHCNRRHFREAFGESGSTPSRRELLWAGSLLLALLGGWGATEWAARNKNAEMRQGVIDRMRMAAAAIDLSLVESLVGDDTDLARPEYDKLKRQMTRFAQANEDLRFAMLMNVRGNEARFLVDSEPPSSGDYSPPGQVYDDAPEGYLDLVRAGQPFVMGPFTDRWGTWVGGTHPIRQLSGGKGWVSLDLDIAATRWEAAVLRSRVPVLVITLLVSSLLLMFFHAQLRARETFRDLLRSEQRSTSIVEGSPNCVQMIDLEGRTIAVNRNGLAALGREQPEVVGRPFLELWPSGSQAALLDALEKARNGAPRTTEVEYARPDGRVLTFALTLSPVGDSQHGIQNLVSIAVDITARKEYEEALRRAKDAAEAAARVKSEFLAVMSHEIRTPLGGVIGTLDLLRRLPQPPQQRHYTTLAHESAELLLDILDDILDAAKIDAGRLELERIPFRVRVELGRVVECMRVRAMSKGLELSCNFDESVPEVLIGDPTRLRQVLTNLLSNAIKFTAHGSVRVDLGVPAADAERVQLRLRVSDTGIGIDPETRARLFQKFEQGDVSTTRCFGGTGLGLSIARHLSELMGGSIDVESAPGCGATFTVVVALAPAALESIRVIEENERPAELPAHRARLRILCAEDEPINRVIAEGLVNRMGHVIDFADDGRVAVEKLSRRDYDVVLMDNRMPHLDGLGATRIIRDSSSPVRDHAIYIIAATANVSDTHREECTEAGMNDYVAKPLREAELHSSLSRAISFLQARGRSLPPVEEEDSEKELASAGEAPGLSEEELLAMMDQPEPAAAPAVLDLSIVQQYLVDAPARLETMREALGAGDWDALGIAAHSLKNISHYVAASTLSSLSAALEKAADAHDREESEAAFQRVEIEFAAVKASLEARPLNPEFHETPAG